MKAIFLKLILTIFFGIFVGNSYAWEGMPMSQLHVEGRYLKDSTGHIVNLHGFMQTYSPWFNEQGTKWTNYDVNGCLTYNQGIIDKILAAGWKMNFVRMHMDPYWSNTPGCTGRYEGEECFNETRFKKYLDEVFVPMAEYAVSKGLYVVMRPPGVSPDHIEIDGVYHNYLIKVWGIVSKHAKLKNHPNIMFELANEPIDILGPDGTYGANTQGHYDNLKTYFQTITDTIRASADNIIWIPGLGYQSLYAGFALNPIEGENIGYAVHVYPGWFNSGNGYEPFQRGWDRQVQPVADFAPIIVTEMDWAPERHDKSWGKDSTGVAGGNGFGANFKKITDDCGNVSWLLFTGPELLAQYGDSNAPEDIKDFLSDPEACPSPVYNWFQEYASAYNFEGASEEYLTLSDLQLVEGENISVLNKSSQSLKINAVFTDGHIENVSAMSQISSSNPEAIKVIRGRIFAISDGKATLNIDYSDAKGNKKQLTLTVTSSTFPLTENLFNPDIWENGTFTETTRTLKTGPYGFGGWQYDGIDLTGSKYIVARIGGSNTANVNFNIFDGSSYWGSAASYKFADKREIVIPLKYAFRSDGKPLNPAHIYIAGFWSNGSNPFVIDTVFLSNSSEFDFPIVLAKNIYGDELTKIEGLNYSLSGTPHIKSIHVLGDMLTSNITITAPNNFEISFFETDGFTSSLSIYHENGIVHESEVFIRLKSDLVQKSYSGSLTVTSDGASTKKITLSGKAEQTVSVAYVSNNMEIVAKEYFSITGQKIQRIENWKGLYIEKNLMSDGSIRTMKKFKNSKQ